MTGGCWGDLTEKISTLRGIEYLTGLQRLYCQLNDLQELDLTNNKELRIVQCGSNSRLKSLDLSGLTKLTELKCSRCQLEFLGLAGDTALNNISIGSNSLKSLNLSTNINLDYADASNMSQLETLILGNNTKLREFYINSSALSYLDIRNCTMLSALLQHTEATDQGSTWRWKDDSGTYPGYFCCDKDVIIRVTDQDYFGTDSPPPEAGPDDDKPRDEWTVQRLPADLKEIEEKAFMGTASYIVIIPQGCRKIGSYSFAYCPNLREVRIEGNPEIGNTAFIGNRDDLVILSDSAEVREWAEQHGLLCGIPD